MPIYFQILVFIILQRYLLVQIADEGKPITNTMGKGRTITNPTGKGRSLTNSSNSVQVPNVKVTNVQRPRQQTVQGQNYIRAGGK